MQGQLRNAPLEVEINSACANSDNAIKVVIDSDLNYRILTGSPSLLVFEPDVDWNRFQEPNILNGY